MSSVNAFAIVMIFIAIVMALRAGGQRSIHWLEALASMFFMTRDAG